MMLRALLKTIAGVAFSLLVAALIGEAGLRLIGPAKLGVKVYSDLRGDPYPAVPSDYLPFTTSPEASVSLKAWEYQTQVTFNALGYRGRYPERIEKAGKRRVLLLGDSVTLGWGIDQPMTFAGLLQERFGSSVEIINAAYHGGYSPDSYYAYLVREGMALQPDVIVLVLTQNDIIDIDNHQWLETDDTGAPVRVRTMITYPGPDGYIITGLPWHYEVPYLRESYVFIGITDRIYSLVTDRIRSENATHADLLARFRTALRAIGELSDRNRVELLVTIVPPPFRTRILKFREDYEVMRQSLADLGRDYIDLKPLLRPDDYFFSDGHFSRRGHGTVANLLFPQISERLAGRAPPSARTACQMVSGEPATAAALSCTSAMHRP